MDKHKFLLLFILVAIALVMDAYLLSRQTMLSDHLSNNYDLFDKSENILVDNSSIVLKNNTKHVITVSAGDDIFLMLTFDLWPGEEKKLPRNANYKLIIDFPNEK